MNRKPILFLFISCLLAAASQAQQTDYKTRIQLLYSGINSKLTDGKTGLYYETTDISKNENPHSWLWPLCALIQATNEMEVLEPGKDYMEPVTKAIDQYYSDKPPLNGYQDYTY